MSPEWNRTEKRRGSDVCTHRPARPRCFTGASRSSEEFSRDSAPRSSLVFRAELHAAAASASASLHSSSSCASHAHAHVKHTHTHTRAPAAAFKDALFSGGGVCWVGGGGSPFVRLAVCGAQSDGSGCAFEGRGGGGARLSPLGSAGSLGEAATT